MDPDEQRVALQRAGRVGLAAVGYVVVLGAVLIWTCYVGITGRLW